MTTDPSTAPNLTDDDYVLMTKWAYNLSVRAALPEFAPEFGDDDHDLFYKVASASYQLAAA